MTSPHKKKRISTLRSYKFELQRKKKCQQTRSDNGDDEEEAHCLSNGSLRAAATSVQTDGFSLNEGNRVDSNMIFVQRKMLKDGELGLGAMMETVSWLPLQSYCENV